MELETLKELYPVLSNRAKHRNRTAKYKTIPTCKILKKLVKNGYSISDYQQVNSRKEKDLKYCKHLIRLRHESFTGDTKSVPEIILVNSFDGSCSYRLYLGIFRFACANGLIVQDSNFGTVSIRHIGEKAVISKVLRESNKLIKKSGRIIENINKWDNMVLSDNEQLKFGSIVKDKLMPSVDNWRLLSSRRKEDDTPTLWNVFNRIQENIIQGGILAINENGVPRRTKKINSIDRKITVNSTLWNIADNFFDGIN
jgi:hypothetical protein